MEEKVAGKQTNKNPALDSPKKAHNPIGIDSQWSLGWQGGQSNGPNNSKGFSIYHNQSNIQFGDGKDWKAQDSKKVEMKKQSPMVEKPVWNYDPKNAGKTTMVLGTEKTDYRKKDEVNKERTPTALTKSRQK